MDRSLVEAAQRGDHDAFEALAIGAADRLFAIARELRSDVADLYASHARR